MLAFWVGRPIDNALLAKGVFESLPMPWVLLSLAWCCLSNTVGGRFLALFFMVAECSFGESLLWIIVFSTKISTACTDWPIHKI
jgi:hypothetical protein